MSEPRKIVHKIIMIAAITFSAAALPFSVKACHAALIVLVAAWFFEGQWRSKIGIVRQSLLLQLIVAFFLFQLIGLAFSDNLQQGWLSLEKKIFLLLVPLALATTAIKLREREILAILGAFVMTCLAATLLCLLWSWKQAAMFLSGTGYINPYLGSSSYDELNPMTSQTWLFFSYVSLADGISIHPTYFSLFLCFCILFLLYALRFLKPRIARAAAWFLILYFSVFVVFLSSRIIIIALCIIFLALITKSVRIKPKHVAAMPILLSLILASLIFLNPVTRYRCLQEIDASTFHITPGQQYQQAAHIRASLWWLSFKSIGKTSPLFGAGTGDVENMMARTSREQQITNVIHSADPHNQFLYTLLANGYPGVLLLILCLAVPTYLAWTMNEHLLLGFCFIFSLLCLTESALEVQKGVAFYSLFFPLLFFQLHSLQRFSMTLKTTLRAGR